MDPKFISLLCLGFCLVQRIWAQVGCRDKPKLSAWPGPVIPLRGKVTLQCHSCFDFVKFKVVKKRGTPIPKLQNRLFKNSLTMSPVTAAHAGTYKCSVYYRNTLAWSAYSDPLEILITGVFTKPSIWAYPSPLVNSGGYVILHCRSEVLFGKFILHKEGDSQLSQQISKRLHNGNAGANFSMEPMIPVHAGTYRCYGSHSHSPYEWSAPSDPLELTVTGMYKKPSLLAQPSHVVMSGENVTLHCRSESSFDGYHLSKDGKTHESWLPGVQSHDGAFQGDFPLGPVSPAHGGTYRCYGSFHRSPYEWSYPSDPLHLLVTGTSTSTCLSPTEPSTKTDSHFPHGHPRQLDILIGLSVVSICIVIFFLALVCHWCSTKSTTDASITDREPKEDQTMDDEYLTAEEPEEAIYAQLNHWTLTQRRVTSTSLSPKYSSLEPSIFMGCSEHQAQTQARPCPQVLCTQSITKQEPVSYS
ncbi:putative killer cell immunoglobulin-like receptor like protein KIR3DP1 isoform X2 [Loxodonta africana]|nr:putative killer cell immunoglobulin-like receptor like protein KIR3DP1 isoform X2 [Loxodonta africana]